MDSSLPNIIRHTIVGINCSNVWRLTVRLIIGSKPLTLLYFKQIPYAKFFPRFNIERI